MGVHHGSAQYPQVGGFSPANRRTLSRARGFGREGPVRDLEGYGVARRLFAGRPSSRSDRLYAQALFLAESNRNLVWDPDPPPPQARRVFVQGSPEKADSGFHRIFQPNSGKTVPLDVYREALGGLGYPAHFSRRVLVITSLPLS